MVTESYCNPCTANAALVCKAEILINTNEKLMFQICLMFVSLCSVWITKMEMEEELEKCFKIVNFSSSYRNTALISLQFAQWPRSHFMFLPWCLRFIISTTEQRQL